MRPRGRRAARQLERERQEREQREERDVRPMRRPLVSIARWFAATSGSAAASPAVSGLSFQLPAISGRRSGAISGVDRIAGVPATAAVGGTARGGVAWGLTVYGGPAVRATAAVEPAAARAALRR